MNPFHRREMLQFSLAALTPLAWNGFAQCEESLPISGVKDHRLISLDEMMIKVMNEHHLPGASLAVTHQGKLVYARGFGYANRANKTPVLPNSLFRVASVSKPITAVAIFHCLEQKKLKLDDPVLKHINLKPFLVGKETQDPRWQQITIRQCLQHTGGWDLEKSFDPCFRIFGIAKEMKTSTPLSPDQLVRYMLGKQLDFDPGQRYAYSNFGYLVLGAVIEAVSNQSYDKFIHQHLFAPLKITTPVLARAFPEDRPKLEVTYYDKNQAQGRCLYPPKVGEKVLYPDGAMNVEAFTAHGGWVMSAPDLVRFATALDHSKKSPLLSESSLREMFARPTGRPGHQKNGNPKSRFYSCGWNVVINGKNGPANTFHNGLIPGTSSLLVRRHDDIHWAVLFNTDRTPGNKILSDVIDPLLHEAIDRVKTWPKEAIKL